MTAIEILIEEHRLIKLFLSAMGSMLERMDNNEEVEYDDMHNAVSFIEEFVDGYHHDKEERILFDLMKRMQFEDPQDQIGNLESEHFFGRTFCAGMDEAIEVYKTNRAEGRAAYIDSGKAYVALMVQHVCKEDKQFFPWCEKQITQDLSSNLLRDFDRSTQTEANRDIFQKWSDWVKSMAENYGESAEVIKACG